MNHPFVPGVRRLSTLLLLAVLSTACTEDDPTGPDGQITGDWMVSASIDGRACNEGVTSASFNVRIDVGTNDRITVRVNDVTYVGTVTGNSATFESTFPEDGGTTTERFEVEFSNQNTRVQGGSTWTFTSGSFSCSGTSQITGSKR